ncbi:HAD family hydrolase [Paracoccus sp. M683]|uniref:HAD family hydrolase n=1 Tax=Paracoccus sp. M683 TaxID=2594268 RepID=UPI001180C85A|nr:HAD family hydrolase [Paracoccus sp. M683]TRW98463.1 HAD family hydrolase [Paracoccus sp. M683]
MEWIGFDADDTLWENETFFRTTQAGFAELLAGHATPDRIAAHLFDTERRNLDRYGYGIKGFMLSMVQTALELTDRRLPGEAVARILEMGQDMLAHPVHLLDGAAGAVEALSDRRRILITKGDVLDQERKIALSGLAERFDAIEIVQHKTPQAYGAIFARHGIDPDGFVMAGNSMNSDILPVLAAGGHAVLIDHPLTWAHEQAPDPDHPRFHRLDRIADLPALIERLSR